MSSFSEHFQSYVGVHLVYCSLKVNEEYDYQSKVSSEFSRSETGTWDLHAFAPGFKLGTGISLSPNVLFIDDNKQIVAAKDKPVDKGEYFTSEADLPFGSNGLKVGFRLMF